ncbi:hypothetical protein SAMN04488598_10733 [Halanaerobium congolense]|uniref:Uncharacterized protein n=1 Tax=Halanaerobium congolense TaxID=54121 RepID=A0A1H9ZRG9_9FIRM|nr:hypothetical protein [Halanaerobium congolense]PTX16360.1 hypothetical protein C7953_1074 [Halanaerobium congolense]SDF16103.1 hypothetical protein SAMN04488598_10733 [Halanaerobium congolense]SES84302.1 hypothetical protein SAMN04515652_10833 [Halanaerobium congolense]SFP45208.1 hypothetical protein SAMN04488596_12033 [Halanaerobium congolense]
MNKNAQKMTYFFKKAVAAQSNLKIDFKKDESNKYVTILKEDFIAGKLDAETSNKVFQKLNKNDNDKINIIICPKVIKTKFVFCKLKFPVFAKFFCSHPIGKN